MSAIKEYEAVNFKNQSWIIDYYNSIIYHQDDIDTKSNKFPLNSVTTKYSFKKLDNILYFSDEFLYYKIEGNKVIGIDKEDYFKALSSITINNYKKTKDLLVSLMVEDILTEKCDVVFLAPYDQTLFVHSFGEQMSAKNANIGKIASIIFSNIPSNIDEQGFKGNVVNAYGDIKNAKPEEMAKLLDEIYSSNIPFFEGLSKDLKDIVQNNDNQIVFK